MKRLIVNKTGQGLITFLVLTFLWVKPVLAENEEQICTSIYGGGVVCGVKTEHKPVETGIADNPAFWAFSLLISSIVLGRISKRLKDSAA